MKFLGLLWLIVTVYGYVDPLTSYINDELLAGTMSNTDGTRDLLQRVVQELLRRGGLNYMNHVVSPNSQGQSNCTTILMNTLRNVGDDLRFKQAIDSRKIPELPFLRETLMETSFPFRAMDRDSSTIMHHTMFAFDVLQESLLEGGCSPIEINSVLRDVPEIEELFKKFLMPKKLCPFHTPYYSCAPGTPYRTFDGSCNNLHFPWWGKSKMPFVRYLPPKYDDYIGAARYNRTIRGRPLPNPLYIARNLLFDRRKFDFRVTNLFGLFSRFILNDLYATSIEETEYGLPAPCDCIHKDYDNCMYLESQGSCTSFPRSAASYLSADCTFLPREQINTVTAWLDLSQIYGSTTIESENLRLFEAGMLKTTQFQSYEYPPMVNDTTLCIEPYKGHCFNSGDKRINENMGIASIYTLFIREHNKIASELHRINPLWKDEDIFQEARRISIAQYQHIIAKEFLPVLLGPDVVVANDLLPTTSGYSKSYNENYEPTIRNELASAIGPAMFTMFRSFLSRYSPRLMRIDEVPYSSINFNLSQAFNASTQGLNAFLRGMLMDYSAKFDKHFASALHADEHTSQKTVYASRKNLPANAVLMGRDHGLASYNDYRQYCGLPRLTSFTDLMSHMDLETVALLSQLYSDVDDIELFIGGISELPVTNALTGPTFACLIAAQFQVIKQGDRFYYDSDNLITRFTPEQLNEIRFVSLSRLMCESISELPFIQPNAFLTSLIDGNERKPCFTFRRRMMQPWFDSKQVRVEPEMTAPRIVDLASGIHMMHAW